MLPEQSVRKRGRPPKYATEEERLEAKREANRRASKKLVPSPQRQQYIKDYYQQNKQFLSQRALNRYYEKKLSQLNN